MPLGWRTWRYLEIDVEAGEEPLRIRVANVVQRVSVRGEGVFSVGHGFAGADLEDWVEDGAAGCARHVYGHAVLGEIAVHRGYADPGDGLVYGGGGRPIGETGD